jgi:DNA-directed RNA polymerase specialized sigma24 family protein
MNEWAEQVCEKQACAEQVQQGHHTSGETRQAAAGKAAEGGTVRLRASRLGAGRAGRELGRAVRVEGTEGRPLPQPLARPLAQPLQRQSESSSGGISTGGESGVRPRFPERPGRLPGRSSGSGHGTDRGVDLRLRLRRQAAETIVERAQLLNPADRGLLEAVYSSGHSVQQVGRLMGVVAPNRLRRLRARVRQLVARVGDPQFVFVSQAKASWPPARREVAELCIMQGASMRDAARRMGVSLYTVRQHRQRIETLYEASLAVRGALQARGGGS